MECLLCTMWNKMPYAKRYSTPVSVGEAEGALVIGYWVATRKAGDTVVRLCERHMSVVNVLDSQEEARKAAEAQREEALKKAEAQRVIPHTQDPHLQQRLAEVQQRREELIASAPPVVPSPALPNYQGPFTIGPGPLGSNALITEQLAAPPTVQTGISVPGVPNPGQPMTPLGSGQGPAPQNAALIDAPCLFCKVMVLTGEVHNCPQAGAKGN